MKYTLTFIILAIYFNATAQVLDNYKLSNEYKGRVKSIRQIILRYKDDHIDSNQRTRTYDINGRLQKDIYDYFGNVEDKFIYNARGVLIEVLKKSEGKERRDQEYKYDEKGHLIEKLNFGSNEDLIAKYVYAYNNEDMLTEEQVAVVFPQTHIKHVYRYNENGKKVQKISFYSDDTVYTSYKYDEHGREIKRHKGDSFREFNETCDINYNDGNLVVAEICTGKNGVTKREIKYEFPDVKGNYQKRTYHNNGKISSVEHYSFEYY